MSRRRRHARLPGIARGEVAKHPGHVFVERGDTALTRALLAKGALRVVGRRRGRIQQLGVAALPETIEAARAEVAASAPRRAIARERGRESRERAEAAYRLDFEGEVRRAFPSIPDEDCRGIVERSCEVSSGRVGRSKAAKELEANPIRLAVLAWIRHAHTDYEARLRRAGLGQRFGRASQEDRKKARKAIKSRVAAVAALWAKPKDASEQDSPVPAQAALPEVSEPVGADAGKQLTFFE